jgi:chromate reductase
MKVLGISGSLRRASVNTMALHACVQLAPADMVITPYDIRDIPMYDGDLEAAGMPAPVAALRAAIASADAVLLVTPEYNGSVPAVLKNAIDWASRPPSQPFNEKPVAILGVSPGALGTIRAQLHLRQILSNINAMVLNAPQVLIGGSGQKFDADGQLIDEGTRKFVGHLLTGLEVWAAKLKA